MSRASRENETERWMPRETTSARDSGDDPRLSMRTRNRRGVMFLGVNGRYLLCRRNVDKVPLPLAHLDRSVLEKTEWRNAQFPFLLNFLINLRDGGRQFYVYIRISEPHLREDDAALIAISS